jgi:hypothetical protein
VSGAGQAYAENAAGRAQGGLAGFNAQVAHLQEIDAIQRGDSQAGHLQSQVDLLRGKQTASFAGQGVDVTAGGTPAQVAMDTSTMSALDLNTIRINARREAFGYGVQEQDALYRQRIDELRGRNAAFATLLTAGNKATSYWGKDADSANILGKRDAGARFNSGDLNLPNTFSAYEEP